MENKYMKDAVKNSYFVLTLSVIGILIGYCLRIFLSRSLTITDFGLFYAVGAFVGLFTIVRYLGLNQALTKFIPEFLISNEKAKIKSSFLSVLIIQGMTILTFTIIVFIFQDFISASLFKSDKSGMILVLMTLSFFPSMFFTIFQSVFQGYQKLRIYASIEPARISLTFIFSVLFIGFGVVGVALAYLTAAIITTLIFLPSFEKLNFLKAKTRLSSELIKKLFKFAVPVFMGSIALLVISYTDTLVITFFRTLEEVALYQIALPTTQLLLVFSSAISAVIFPLTSHLYSSKKPGEIGKGVKIIIILLMMVLLPFVILLFTFPEVIIQLLFGSEFLLAARTMQILSVGMIFYSIFVVFQTTLDGIGRPFMNTKILFTMAILNLVMNIAFVPVMGIMGSAFAFAATFFLGMVMGLNYTKKYLKIELAYLRLIKIFFGAVISVGAIFVLKILMDLPIYEEFIIAIIIGWTIFIVIVTLSKSITKDDIEFIESKNFHMPNSFKRTIKIIFRRRR